MGSPDALWAQQARQWALLGQPLRPGDEDITRSQDSIDLWVRDNAAPPTALILGVTPELAGQRWPAGSRVIAVDRSMVMIRGVWPGARGGLERRVAVRADWTDLPLRDRCCDVVFGDSCFANVPHAQRLELARSVHRVLDGAGVFTTRMFVRPDIDERPDEVWQQLVDRRISSFAVFKFRLLMSLRRDNGDVSVAEARDYFRSRCPSEAELAEHLGWPLEEVQTIQAYRGQPAVYWFPTLAEFGAAVTEVFDEAACHWPRYEMGDRCPTFVLRA